MDDRWEVILYCPVDMSIMWTTKGRSLKSIAEKWNEETGNDYISTNKLTRASLGRSVNPFVSVHKVG